MASHNTDNPSPLGEELSAPEGGNEHTEDGHHPLNDQQQSAGPVLRPKKQSSSSDGSCCSDDHNDDDSFVEDSLATAADNNVGGVNGAAAIGSRMSSVENDRDTLDSPVPGEAVLLSESMQAGAYIVNEEQEETHQSQPEQYMTESDYHHKPYIGNEEIQAAPAGNLDAHVQSFNLQHQNHTGEFGALHEEENSVMNDCEDSLDEAGNMAGQQGENSGIEDDTEEQHIVEELELDPEISVGILDHVSQSENAEADQYLEMESAESDQLHHGSHHFEEESSQRYEPEGQYQGAYDRNLPGAQGYAPTGAAGVPQQVGGAYGGSHDRHEPVRQWVLNIDPNPNPEDEQMIDMSFSSDHGDRYGYLSGISSAQNSLQQRQGLSNSDPDLTRHNLSSARLPPNSTTSSHGHRIGGQGASSGDLAPRRADTVGQSQNNSTADFTSSNTNGNLYQHNNNDGNFHGGSGNFHDEEDDDDDDDDDYEGYDAHPEAEGAEDDDNHDMIVGGIWGGGGGCGIGAEQQQGDLTGMGGGAVRSNSSIASSSAHSHPPPPPVRQEAGPGQAATTQPLTLSSMSPPIASLPGVGGGGGGSVGSVHSALGTSQQSLLSGKSSSSSTHHHHNQQQHPMTPGDGKFRNNNDGNFHKDGSFHYHQHQQQYQASTVTTPSPQISFDLRSNSSSTRTDPMDNRKLPMMSQSTMDSGIGDSQIANNNNSATSRQQQQQHRNNSNNKTDTTTTTTTAKPSDKSSTNPKLSGRHATCGESSDMSQRQTPQGAIPKQKSTKPARFGGAGGATAKSSIPQKSGGVGRGGTGGISKLGRGGGGVGGHPPGPSQPRVLTKQGSVSSSGQKRGGVGRGGPAPGHRAGVPGEAASSSAAAASNKKPSSSGSSNPRTLPQPPHSNTLTGPPPSISQHLASQGVNFSPIKSDQERPSFTGDRSVPSRSTDHSDLGVQLQQRPLQMDGQLDNSSSAPPPPLQQTPSIDAVQQLLNSINISSASLNTSRQAPNQPLQNLGNSDMENMIQLREHLHGIITSQPDPSHSNNNHPHGPYLHNNTTQQRSGGQYNPQQQQQQVLSTNLNTSASQYRHMFGGGAQAGVNRGGNGNNTNFLRSSPQNAGNLGSLYDQISSLAEEDRQGFGRNYGQIVGQDSSSMATTDLLNSDGGSLENMLKYLSSSDAHPHHQQQQHNASSQASAGHAANMETKFFRDAYEKEQFRRKHCEDLIQDLQSKILENQEQLVVAMEMARRKDHMIQQLDKTLGGVVDKWKKAESDRQHKMAEIQTENEALKRNIQAQQQGWQKIEGELQTGVEQLSAEIHKYKNTDRDRQIELRLKDEECSLLNNEVVIQRKRGDELSNECQGLSDRLEKQSQQLTQLKDAYDEENQAWEEKERDYLQKIESITDNHMKLIEEGKDKLSAQRHNLDQQESALSATQRHTQQLEMELDTVVREKESLKVQLGLMESKLESNQRKLEAHLTAQLEVKLHEQQEELLKRAQATEDELRERHKQQVYELNNKHKRDVEKNMAQLRQDLQNREERYRDKEQTLHDIIGELKSELDEMKELDRQHEIQRVELAAKLPAMMQAHCNEALRLLQQGVTLGGSLYRPQSVITPSTAALFPPNPPAARPQDLAQRIGSLPHQIDVDNNLHHPGLTSDHDLSLFSALSQSMNQSAADLMGTNLLTGSGSDPMRSLLSSSAVPEMLLHSLQSRLQQSVPTTAATSSIQHPSSNNSMQSGADYLNPPYNPPGPRPTNLHATTTNTNQSPASIHHYPRSLESHHHNSSLESSPAASSITTPSNHHHHHHQHQTEEPPMTLNLKPVQYDGNLVAPLVAHRDTELERNNGGTNYEKTAISINFKDGGAQVTVPGPPQPPRSTDLSQGRQNIPRFDNGGSNNNMIYGNSKHHDPSGFPYGNSASDSSSSGGGGGRSRGYDKNPGGDNGNASLHFDRDLLRHKRGGGVGRSSDHNDSHASSNNTATERGPIPGQSSDTPVAATTTTALASAAPVPSGGGGGGGGGGSPSADLPTPNAVFHDLSTQNHQSMEFIRRQMQEQLSDSMSGTGTIMLHPPVQLDLSALQAETSTAEPRGRVARDMVNAPALRGNQYSSADRSHGSSSTSSDKSQPRVTWRIGAGAGTNGPEDSTLDYSDTGNTSDQHESRQAELQKYIKLLLNKPPASSPRDESSPGVGSTQTVDHRITSLATETESNPNGGESGGVGGVGGGGLSSDEMGEMSRLVGMYKQNENVAHDMQDVLSYLKEAQENRYEPPEQPGRSPQPEAPSPESPRPEGQGGPPPSSPRKPLTKARRNLESTYKISKQPSITGAPTGTTDSAPKPKQSNLGGGTTLKSAASTSATSSSGSSASKSSGGAHQHGAKSGVGGSSGGSSVAVRKNSGGVKKVDRPAPAWK